MTVNPGITAGTTTDSRRRTYLALAALALPTLLVAVDIAVLNVALPTMGRELHASATELVGSPGTELEFAL